MSMVNKINACPAPLDEAERLRLLHALNILDTAAEPAFDRITRLAARMLGVPIALISLVDAERQWFKSRVGVDISQVPREVAFCSYAILQQEPMIVNDALRDERFVKNPLVLGNPCIRFYAGVPLRSMKGFAIGTLCAIDTVPRELSEDDKNILIDLAGLASKEIQMREAEEIARSQISQSEQGTRAAESRFQTIFDRAGVGIALVAPDGKWVNVNEAFCQIVGYSAEELHGLTFHEMTHPDDVEADLHLTKKLIDGEIDRYQLEKRYIHKNGNPVWINLIVTKQVGPQGELEYLVSIVKDIQARKEAEASLAELRRELEERVEKRTSDLLLANTRLSSAMAQQMQSEQALRKREAELHMVIDNASDAYVCVDQDGVISQWNRQAEKIFGWSSQEAMGRSLAETIIPENMREAHCAGMKRYLETGKRSLPSWQMELVALRRDGHTLPVEVRVTALESEGKTIFSAFLSDITERKRAEVEREYEASHDALTGLPNRRKLFSVLPQAMARSGRCHMEFSLIFIDLDGFKQVNDGKGHEAGDSVLRAVAARLLQSIRQTDMAARLGGDEFTVVLENLSDGVENAKHVAYKILSAIQQPISIGSEEVHIGASIGIALHQPGDAETVDQLVSRADAAMYEAKRMGKGQVRVK
ncbi:PAS domain S-box protein [Delftia sp. PS-11]|uniref:PAS domain S-box protein n=1 Tax=Delftia sp. PS-11 TaxID=2767222 RepID=UPI003AB8C6F0